MNTKVSWAEPIRAAQNLEEPGPATVIGFGIADNQTTVGYVEAGETVREALHKLTNAAPDFTLLAVFHGKIDIAWTYEENSPGGAELKDPPVARGGQTVRTEDYTFISLDEFCGDVTVCRKRSWAPWYMRKKAEKGFGRWVTQAVLRGAHRIMFIGPDYAALLHLQSTGKVDDKADVADRLLLDAVAQAV